MVSTDRDHTRSRAKSTRPGASSRAKSTRPRASAKSKITKSRPRAWVGSRVETDGSIRTRASANSEERDE